MQVQIDEGWESVVSSVQESLPTTGEPTFADGRERCLLDRWSLGRSDELSERHEALVPLQIRQQFNGGNSRFGNSSLIACNRLNFQDQL